MSQHAHDRIYRKNVALPCANESLHEVYVMKEQFRFIFKSNDESHTIIRLSEWISMAMKSSVIPLVRFTKNLAKSFNEVANSIRYKVTSAAIESTNAKIKRIQSKTCGLFNIKYLFQKIRQIYFISRNLYDQQIWRSPHQHTIPTSMFDKSLPMARMNQ